MMILVAFFTFVIRPRKTRVSRLAIESAVAVAAPRNRRKSLKRACGGCPDELFSAGSRPKAMPRPGVVFRALDT